MRDPIRAPKVPIACLRPADRRQRVVELKGRKARLSERGPIKSPQVSHCLSGTPRHKAESG